MAQYEHLPIYKKAFDMTVYIEKSVRDFSRYHKYTLGSDLRNLSRGVLRLVVKANSEKDKEQSLRQLRDTVEELKAVARVRQYMRAGSANGRHALYCMHLDIKNFFMSIDKHILFELLRKKVRDERLLWLAHVIIFHDPAKNCIIKGNKELLNHLPSHKSLFHAKQDTGLPVGNLTSQFFANLYLNELDQYVKHTLKQKMYVRYCDDFLLLHRDPESLEQAREEIGLMLASRLSLELNEKFTGVREAGQGIDFLGYVIRPGYVLARRRVVNTLKTKLGQFEKSLMLEKGPLKIARYEYARLEKLRVVLASYFGHLKWADTHRLKKSLIERYAFLKEFFSFDSGRIKPRYRFIECFPAVRSQYLYFARMFPGAAVCMQVGRFYEMYREKSPAAEAMNLNPLKPNRRGACYGFPVHAAMKYARMLA